VRGVRLGVAAAVAVALPPDQARADVGVRVGNEKLVSLHAWEPLTEAAAVLRRVVESTR
jgi:hypothetical protein